MKRDVLLTFEKATSQKWLSCFDVHEKPVVGIGPSKETFYVKSFPLPDKYKPDHLSIVIEISHYPQDPPKGIYLLTTETNRSLIAMLQSKFNIFQDTAYHGAASIQGYTWICIGYGLQGQGWKFNAREPNKGDNLCKLLQHFWRILEE